MTLVETEEQAEEEVQMIGKTYFTSTGHIVHYWFLEKLWKSVCV